VGGSPWRGKKTIGLTTLSAQALPTPLRTARGLSCTGQETALKLFLSDLIYKNVFLIKKKKQSGGDVKLT
jgi:hypothetical protein